jgi:hypothetical protein
MPLVRRPDGGINLPLVMSPDGGINGILIHSSLVESPGDGIRFYVEAFCCFGYVPSFIRWPPSGLRPTPFINQNVWC